MKLKSPAILKAFMDQKNMSMARLARYADCSKSFIGHLATGHKKSCTPELADRIAEGLGVPTVALFDVIASADSGRSAKTKVA